MPRYFLEKLVEAIVAIWGVVTIVFFVTRLLGDPVTLLLPVGATLDQINELRTGLGLDQPMWLQYVRWISAP